MGRIRREEHISRSLRNINIWGLHKARSLVGGLEKAIRKTEGKKRMFRYYENWEERIHGGGNGSAVLDAA